MKLRERRQLELVSRKLTFSVKFTRVSANFFGLFPRTKWNETLAMSYNYERVNVKHAKP